MLVALPSLWLPIILSAVAVFVASSVVWTVIQWHNADWSPLPDEESTRHALKDVAAGEYSVPYAATARDRQDGDWKSRCEEGPVALITIFPPGLAGIGKKLSLWMVYCLAVSVVVAYVAGATIAPGADYLRVFKITGIISFLAYCGAAAQGPIWFGHTGGRALRDTLDGFIYGVLTAGFFGWLWP